MPEQTTVTLLSFVFDVINYLSHDILPEKVMLCDKSAVFMNKLLTFFIKLE